MQPLRYLRWWLAGGYALLAMVIALSLLPSLPGLPELLIDKGGHVVAYFVLMGWFAGIVMARYRWRVAVGLALLGVGLEVLQGLMGARVYEEFDMLANVVGVALGWLAALVGAGGWCARCERLVAR